VSVTKQRSGRWRAQVWSDGKWIPVATVIGGPRSFGTKREAQLAKEAARAQLDGSAGRAMTVAQWRDRWTTDPLYARPVGVDEPAQRGAHQGVRREVRAAAARPRRRLRRRGVARRRQAPSTVPALRAMFGDATTAKAGRLLRDNPFAGLGLEKKKGNKEKQPPTEEQAWTLIEHARAMTPPSFAAYLEVACWTAARPGELDALRWDWVDLDGDELDLREQWNAKTRTFTLPKHQHPHPVTLTPNARATLLRLPRDSEFVFTTLRGTHYTPSSRTHHWNRVRAAAGMADVTLYLATRHFFGWYALNVVGLEPALIAEQLGHRDGGKLVEDLYGHPDRKLRREKLRAAFEQHGQVRPLRVVRQDEAG
jgi:integrase